MSYLGVNKIDGSVPKMYMQAQAAAATNPINQNMDNAINQSMLTNSLPLASAVNPIKNESATLLGTTQASNGSININGGGSNPQTLKFAASTPAPEGCGNNLNCVA